MMNEMTKQPLLDSNDGPPSYSQLNTVMYSAQPPMTTMALPPSRNAMHVAMGLDGTREWSHGLCSCTERPGLAIAACLCPCMLYSGNKVRLQSLAMTGNPHSSPTRAGYGLWCCLYALSPQVLGVGQVVLSCLTRFRTRARYHIQGDVAQDVLIAAFCTCCTLVQERREIEEEEQFLRMTENQEGGPTLYRDAPFDAVAFAV